MSAPLGAAVSSSRTELPPRAASSARLGRSVVGGFFLSMGGVHLGIVAADTGFYRHFADGALFSFVRHGWADVFGFWLWSVPALCLLVPLARKDWPRLAGQENV